MKRLLISAAAVSSLTLGGCASDPYRDHVVASSATGAVIGAGAGALVGAAFGGVGAGPGAVVGGALGATAGAIIGDHQYYRDTRGYCYYVDHYGRAHYSYHVHC
jgi:hypothetical protein